MQSPITATITAAIVPVLVWKRWRRVWGAQSRLACALHPRGKKAAGADGARAAVDLGRRGRGQVRERAGRAGCRFARGDGRAEGAAGVARVERAVLS